MSKVLTTEQKWSQVMLFILMIIFISIHAKADYGPYDVSMLLDAKPYVGFGHLPELDFDFSKIRYLPVFNRLPNSSQKVSVSGLVDDSTRIEIAKAFQAHRTEPLSWPTNAMVLGMRIDPCSNRTFSDLQRCTFEMRLVAEDPDLHDRSVHLIYSISSTEGKSLLNQIHRLNSQCPQIASMRALTVHPCSQSDEFVDKLNRIVIKFAKIEQLKKLAFQIRTSGDGPSSTWIFEAAIKNSKGHFQDLVTPFTSNGEEFFGFGEGRGFHDGPPPPGLDELVESAHQRKLDQNELNSLIHRLENPKVVNVSNTSCFSCHSNEALRSQLVDDSNKRRGDEVRHFGYTFGQPQISRRTINETKLNLRILSTMNGAHNE